MSIACDPESVGKFRRERGVAPGVNIGPGSDDDGWIVPPPVELSCGTKVQLYKDGEALRICLESYIYAADETGMAFAEALSKKAQEGLNVYVIYDSFGSIATDRDIFERMRRAGVRVGEFHPIRPWDCKYSWRPFSRDHRKMLVVDDAIAGLGGLNVATEYGGSWVGRRSRVPQDMWRDNAVGFAGPGARAFLSSFAKTWNYIARGGRVARAEHLHDVGILEEPAGDLGLLASVPTRSGRLRKLWHELFGRAKSRIEMTMAYFAPHDSLIKELVNAAKRGVRVRLMLPAVCDVPILVTAARSFYDSLLGAGVEIYERQHVVLHAKTACIDGETSIIGSTNLDYRSIEYNLELSAIIRSTQFGGHMHALFENDVLYAKRSDPKIWRRRPFRDRIGQWMVSRARYLL